MTGRAPRVAGRLGAVLAVGSAALHGIMAVHATEIALAVLIIAMASMCLMCARELWVAPTKRVWGLVAATNLAMIALHLQAPGGNHHGGSVVAATAGHPATLMVLATALAAVEVALATAVLYVWSREEARILIPVSGQRLVQLAQRGDQGAVGRVVDRARDDADGVVLQRRAQCREQFLGR